MKDNKKKRQVAETIGAIQDTLRIHADSLDGIKNHIYAMIISLDLIYMDIVSELPEKTRKAILQNQFDESKSGAENDLVALKRIRRYINSRIKDCEKFIKESQDEPLKPKEVGVFGGQVEDIKDEKLKNILLGPHASQNNGAKRRPE